MAPGRRGRPARDAAPRVFLRRGVYAADLRRWGVGRVTLRDPDADGWPAAGDVTRTQEVAVRWALAYVDHYRDEQRREQLRLGPKPRRLGEAAREWIDVRKSRPTSTWQGNRSAVNALREFAAMDAASGRAGDAMRTDRITSPFLQRFFNRMAKEGYAYNTLASYRQAVSAFLRHMGYGDGNAALCVVLDRPEHEEVATWSEDDLVRLRAAADRLDREPGSGFRLYRRALELALATGMRRNELFAVEWQRVDAEQCTVRVVRQLDKVEPRFVAPKGKKPGTALVLPSWWAHDQPGARGLVLTLPDGSIVSPQMLSKLVRRLMRAARLELDGRGWHTFRHTYARDFIVGVRGDFGLLRSSLRHRSIRTTETLYSHFHEDVAAKLARQRIYPDGRLRVV